MSWGGPAAGPATYPPQAFPNAQQAGYGNYQGGPPYAGSGPPPRPPDNRPPKKKGNPIITRYPPPPGYRGPAQPQGPYGRTQYPVPHQPPQPAYSQGYADPTRYPAPAYPVPPSYPPSQPYSQPGYGPAPPSYPVQPAHPQQTFPPTPTYQYPQQGYPPNQAFTQPSGYPGPPAAYAPQHATYQNHPPPPTPVDYQQPYAQGWQPTNPQAPYPSHEPIFEHNKNSRVPNAPPTPISAHPTSAQETQGADQPDSATNERFGKGQIYDASDEWDFSFEGAIWPKKDEPINEDLSIGVITWHPAKEVTRALPSTFEEAEEQALKPPAEKLGNGDSVSIYFTLENSHEAFLDVRQTDDWEKIKDDPVFVVFPDEKDMDLIPIADCIAQRDRPDEPLQQQEEEKDKDEEMADSNYNVMDTLDRALSGHAEDEKRPTVGKEQGSATDRTQEDILASLGVTGSPKPPSDEPVPYPMPPSFAAPRASLPEKPPAPPNSQLHSRPGQPPQRAFSFGGQRHSNPENHPHRPYGSLSATTQKRPPPPDRQEYDPWNPARGANHSRGSSRSESSNHTLAGSDFETDKRANSIGGVQQSDTQPTPNTGSTLGRTDSSFSRKRSYEDTDSTDDKVRQRDDHAKRKKRSQVAAAYSRR